MPGEPVKPKRPAGDFETEGNVLPLGYPRPYAPRSPLPSTDPALWHCGGEVLQVTFKADENRAKLLVPPPLEMGPDSGEGAVWFTEWVSVSETKPDLAFENPEAAVYRECMLLVKCRHKGTACFFAPCVWIDNDVTCMRGLIQGLPKKTGEISLTRLHPLNPRIGGRRVDAKVKGICKVNSEKVIEGSMVFTRPSEPSELPVTRFYLLHRFPTIEDPGRSAIHELTAGRVTEVRIADVWAGEGELKLFESTLGDLPELGPIRGVGAFYFSMGMSVAGGEVIYKYV